MSQHGYSPPSKMECNGSPTMGSGTIGLFIETLTGNTFEMKISPSDTIAALKSKIHRVEGIPVSAQHLLFNLSELEDDSKLSDCSISDGSTLRLVTSMRGGPMSDRRVSPTPEERAWLDLVDTNRCDGLLQRLPSGPLTVLVFCEGEQLNLFRVVENVDGTYSPVPDSVNTSSIQNVLATDEPDAAAQRLHENTITMGKMKEIQRKLSNGVQRRKMKSSVPQASTSKITSGSPVTPTRDLKDPIQCSSTLQMIASRQNLPSTKQCGDRSSPLKKTTCPHRKPTLPRLELPRLPNSKSHHLSAPTPSRHFLPVLSLPRRKPDLNRQSATSSSQSQSLSIPAQPRLMAPPHYVPPLIQRQRHPPLRPLWNQRQGPVIGSLGGPDPKPCSSSQSKMGTLTKDEMLKYVSPQPASTRMQGMCQNRRRLDPIMPQRELLANSHTGIHQPQLYLPPHSTQTETQSRTALHTGLTSSGQKRNALINVSNCVVVPKNAVVHQPAQPQHGACHFILLRGPNTSPKERFMEYLTAYLTQSFSSQYLGMIPENWPMHLSHHLTKRLSHQFVGCLSDVAANQLFLQLTNRISQCLEERFSNRCPKDDLGQALRPLLEERTAQGYPLIGSCIRHTEVWDPHMRVALRGLSTCNADMGSNYIHNPEPSRENSRETRELFAQIPRYHSAPTPLTSQGATVRHSVFTGFQREPLFVRMNDSSVYQRGMVPVLVRPATSPNFPPPVFCNTVRSGPPSMELLRRVIEFSVPQLRQPRLQTEIQRDQSHIQVMNGIGRMTAPFRSPPPFVDAPQKPNYGYQPQGVRWRTIRYSVQPNSQSQLPTEPSQIEPQTGIDDGQNPSSDHSAKAESKLPKKSNRRCCQCRKKLTISNNYLCRCQKLFCSTHRYSEAHNCNFDYKEEGRKLLLQENPQVMAEKIIRM